MSSPANLGEISTRWSEVHDPAQFVTRYARAIRQYLGIVLPTPHDVEDVLQDFLLAMMQNGFGRVDPQRGRFRDYLFIAVRNAAWKYLRRQHSRRETDLPEQLGGEPDDSLEQRWVAEWKQCVLERALDSLHRHQRQSKNNLFHTVLSVTMEQPDADSPEQAAETSRRCGRPVTPEAFRQQRSRAVRLFARLLLEEVAQTLENPMPEQVEAELVEVGLMKYVEPYLPPDWRSHGALPSEE